MKIGRRLVAASLGVLGTATLAAGQPAPRDPYAAPPPAPPAPAQPAGDPEVDDAVAAALVARAQVLVSEGAFGDAKQLVAEALVRSPQGPSAAAAHQLLADLNARLGIGDATPPPVTTAPVAPPAPLPPPNDTHVEPTPERPAPSSDWLTRLGGGIAGGAVAGGLFADVVTGIDSTSAGDVLGGAVLGALGGGLAASALDTPALTTGDHALIDSMTGWGLVAGLTLGLAMDPPKGEAYSLNGVFGIAGGYLVGHLAARRTDVTAARVLRVDGIALAGAALPWLLYPLVSDSSTGTDEQVIGLLSTAGLVVGAYLGFRWTHDAPGGHVAVDGAPPALLQRHHDGGWSLGGLGLRRADAEHGHGAALSLVSGRW